MLLTTLLFLLQATPHVNPNATPFPTGEVTEYTWEHYMVYIIIGLGIGVLGALAFKNRKNKINVSRG